MLHHPRHHLGCQHWEHLRLRPPTRCPPGGLSPSCPAARMIPPASTCGSSHRRDPNRQHRDPPAKPSSLRTSHRYSPRVPGGAETTCPALPFPPTAGRTPQGPPSLPVLHLANGQRPLSKAAPSLAAQSGRGQRAAGVEGSALLGVEGGASELICGNFSVLTALWMRSHPHRSPPFE